MPSSNPSQITTRIPLDTPPGTPPARISITTHHFAETGNVITTATRQTLTDGPGGPLTAVDEADGIQIPTVVPNGSMEAAHDLVLESLPALRTSRPALGALFAGQANAAGE